MSRKYQIYRIDDTETGHYYIGMHRGNIFEDNYWGSGRGMIEHIGKSGKDGLNRSVLHEFADEESCATMEAELVTWDTVSDPLCLNRQPGGWYQGPHSKDSIQRMAKSKIGTVRSAETRKKISEAMKGRSVAEDVKRKIHAAVSGKGNPMYGKRHSKQTREKMSNLKQGEKNNRYGKKHTLQTRDRISETHLRRNNHRDR